MKFFFHLWLHLTEIFLEREKFQTKVAEKIKTHATFNNFSRKKSAVNDIMLKSTVEPDRTEMWRRKDVICMADN
jgi:hypothetical protein